MLPVNRSDLIIPTDRQRKEFEPQSIVDLATSIDAVGLLHPPVIRLVDSKPTLIAGERRIRAMEQLWIMGKSVRVGETLFGPDIVPCTLLGELSNLDAYEAELEENIRRLDLTWQDCARATAELFELRKLQAAKIGQPPPSFETIAKEIDSDKGTTRFRVLVAKHLDDPEVSKASSAEQAFKIVKRKSELALSAELGRKVGETFGRHSHTILNGDCVKLLSDLPSSSFDVILTDPPYGINAQDFGNSDGKAQGEHFYDDTPQAFIDLMEVFIPQTFRLAKPQAHLYVFCDIEWFTPLREWIKSTGWKVFRTPFIWFNPSSQRAPWPTMGPQRKYQIILYAVKGDKNVISLQPDVVTYSSDVNLNHQAQKPVDLFVNLLRRSVVPGDSVIDPFCGTGTIFPAAHQLKVKATGIELDPSAYGIAVRRLEELK